MLKKEKNAAVSAGRKSYSQFGEIWRRFTKNKAAMASLVVVVVILVVAVSASELVDYKTQVIKPHITERLALLSAEHPLGTDELGRDILARIIYGSRISLSIGVMGVASSLALGIILGALAAFYGRTMEAVIMRICDVFEGLPSFLMGVVITAAFGASMFSLIAAITFGSFSGCTRIMRGVVLTVKDQEFIEAARAMGANNRQIITYHIMPNCTAMIIVQATLRIGTAITTASALSFLGLGVQPPDPEWGAMLSSGRQFLLEAPQLTIIPGLVLMITIMAFNILGDGLRDALDPRLKQ